MILWIKASAANMPCDQRAELVDIIGDHIRVKLCGTAQPCFLSPGDVCGLELDKSLVIQFNVSQVRHRSISCIA